jgi:uncharacterized protein YcgI (DUF1989 family)
MPNVEEFIIEGAGQGSVELSAGESIKIINTEGSQVVDLWAFVLADTSECLSTEHTRSCLQKLIPAVGDTLYSNARNPMLTVVEDTSPGIHDMLLSACDAQRYVLLGHVGYHKSCADNLRDAMNEAGYNLPEIPSPFNIFENVLIGADGALSIEPPVVKAGQSITLRAERDIIAVMSCCPMDIALTNGPELRSKPVRVQKLS